MSADSFVSDSLLKQVTDFPAEWPLCIFFIIVHWQNFNFWLRRGFNNSQDPVWNCTPHVTRQRHSGSYNPFLKGGPASPSNRRPPLLLKGHNNRGESLGIVFSLSQEGPLTHRALKVSGLWAEVDDIKLELIRKLNSTHSIPSLIWLFLCWFTSHSTIFSTWNSKLVIVWASPTENRFQFSKSSVLCPV